MAWMSHWDAGGQPLRLDGVKCDGRLGTVHTLTGPMVGQTCLLVAVASCPAAKWLVS